MDTSAQEMMTSCQGLVRSIAWKIHQKLPRQVDLDDLIGYGNLGLAQAAEKFDPERGQKFTTFAYYRVRGAILDGLGQMTWFRLPDYHRGSYGQLANDVVRGGESGSLDGEVDWLHGTCTQLAMVHLLCNASESETFADDRVVPPDCAAMQEDVNMRLNDLVDSLPPPSDELIRRTYFEGLTLKEAGEALGKSKSWASRLHAQALASLALGLRQLGVTDEEHLIASGNR